MRRIRKLLQIAIFKSLWVNFRCFPFKYAIKFTILLARSVRVANLSRNCIHFADLQVAKRRLGGVRIGFQDTEWSGTKQSVLNIQGTLIIKGSGYHSFASGLSLSIAPNAVVEIGDNFSCSHNARIQIFKKLVVGDNNMWSFDTIVMDTDSHKIFNEKGDLISHNQDIIFGDNVWLGCRSIVLKGSMISSGSIIAAGSIVTKILSKENSIYKGNTVIRENVQWSTALNYEKE